MSLAQKDSYSVEVIGFTDTEQTVLASVFGLSARRSPKYVRHTENNSMPDIFLVDSDNEAAVKQLGARNSVGDIPVVLIGDTSLGTNWTLLARPIRWMKLFQAFDATIGYVAPPQAPPPLSASAIAAPAADMVRPETAAFIKPNLVVPAGLSASVSANKPDDAPLLENTATRMKAFAVGSPRLRSVPNASTEWVLVVDDNQTVREFMRNKLAAFNFNVDYAENGEQAIGLTGQRHYSCIFLDVIMPGIDGYQVCKLIKANRAAKKTTVVMLTSKGSPFDKIRGAMSGCDAYLTKPVDEEKLVETIAKFLTTNL
ncbi:MAG: response regulator [Gallionella sp.]|nr:response regulator [Gallionella sp.]